MLGVSVIDDEVMPSSAYDRTERNVMFRPILSALLPTLSSLAAGASQTSEPRCYPCQWSCLTTMTFLTVTSRKRGLGGENLWCDETQQGYVGARSCLQLCVFRMHERRLSRMRELR